MHHGPWQVKFGSITTFDRLEVERLEERRDQPASASHAGPKRRPITALLRSSEGRILLLGVTLALAYTLWLGTRLLYAPEASQVLTGLTATALVFGRAAGLAFGYAMGLAHRTVIPIAMVIETVIVLLFYPLFVFSWRHLLVIKWLRNIFDRIRDAAEIHKAKIQRYGLIGLFAFVWFPFWMTGPVVGCVIGFLLGLKPWLNMAVVLAGTYMAIVAWALFLRQLHEKVASYSSYGPMVLLAILITVIVAGHVLQHTLNGNRKKA